LVDSTNNPVVSQDGKPIAFFSRKLKDAQMCYTTTERELLSIMETRKEYRNVLLGALDIRLSSIQTTRI